MGRDALGKLSLQPGLDGSFPQTALLENDKLKAYRPSQPSWLTSVSCPPPRSAVTLAEEAGDCLAVLQHRGASA